MVEPVRLGTFSPSVLLAVASATGALADAGLEVREVPASSSPAQFAELVAGDLDAVLTSPDNVIAYRTVEDNPLGRTVDVRILAAIDGGLGLSLFAGPAYPSVADLRGGVIGVDVPVSGFAFVAFELLARLGLQARVDCPVESLGATPKRAAALLAGGCAATVLNAGSDLRAEAAGSRRLARATSLGPYLGTVLAAHGPVVDADRGRLWNLTRVLTTTADRLAGGELREVALRAAGERLGLDGRDAERYVDGLTDPAEGLVRGGLVDAEALDTLVWLRNRHSNGRSRLDPAALLSAGLVDDRFLAAGAGFRLNGRPAVSAADPDTPLIYLLRNDFALMGTRFGCGSGLCGACMVLVDGHPTPSCDTPLWAVEGKDVVTVEGLGTDGAPHPLQEEFLGEQAAQCGYCISGILVNAAALLASDPQPTEAAVRAHLDRNLCRCGVHNRVVRAVLRTADRDGGPA